MVVRPAHADATGSSGFDNQVIPVQEEGNAQLIETLGFGAVAERKREVRDLVEEAFAHKGRLWQEWRDNLTKVSQPDDALRIAELILEEAAHVIRPPRTIKLFEDIPRRGSHPGLGLPGAASRALHCDFHIHTNYSDGRLSLPEVIDFYGRRGFDCICITGHIADPRRLIGKFSELLNLTIGPDQVDEYFDMIECERRRAWRKYDMLNWLSSRKSLFAGCAQSTTRNRSVSCSPPLERTPSPPRPGGGLSRHCLFDSLFCVSGFRVPPPVTAGTPPDKTAARSCSPLCP